MDKMMRQEKENDPPEETASLHYNSATKTIHEEDHVLFVRDSRDTNKRGIWEMNRAIKSRS